MGSEARVFIYPKYKRAFRITVLTEGYPKKRASTQNADSQKKKAIDNM
jgi:hypothetical protein